MRRTCFKWIVVLLTIAGQGPAIADAGDAAGWSVATDARGRAFLMWVSEQDGPRALMLGCLRDAGTFTTMSYLVGERDEIHPVKLTLSNGPAQFEVEGSITLYPAIGRSSFISDLEVTAQRLQEMGDKLLPVLEGKDGIRITMEPGTPAGATLAVSIPTEGISAALGPFHDVCFK